MIHLINSLSQGGAEAFLKDVVKAGDIVITLFNHPAVMKMNCRIERLDLMRNPIFALRRVRELSAVNSQLVCWLYIPMFVSLFVGRSVKIFWTVRTSNLHRHSSWHSWALALFLAPFSWVLPAKIIYCSEQSLNWHAKSLLWRNGVVVLNGPKNFSAEHKAYKKSEANRNLKIAVIGRLSPQKGQYWLTKRLSEQSENLGGTEWYFYGRNVSNLESAFQTPVDLKLVFSESLDSYEILKDVDLLVSASLYGEGYPNVVAEAINFGTYVISSDSGAIREMGLREEQIFRCGDEMDLWKCLERYRSLTQPQIDEIVLKAQRYIRETQPRDRQVTIFREILNG